MGEFEINVSLGWGATLVVILGVVGLIIFYKDSIKRFLHNAKVMIDFNLFNIAHINIEKILDLEKQAQSAGILQPESAGEARATQQSENGQADFTARNNVVESWASLKMAINDAALARKIQLTPAAEIPDIVRRLVGANAIKKTLADLIVVLYEEGKEIAAHRDKKVYEGQAIFYQQLVKNLLKSMTLHVTTTNSVPPPPPRVTQVSGYFPPPAPGQPVAMLVGISGPLQGKQFALDKEVFRIGANPDNDLVVRNDDYVSGNHAYLRYEKGSLLIFDQHSHNGTFLNDNRLTDVAMTLDSGDRIRVGRSTFRVTRVPGR